MSLRNAVLGLGLIFGVSVWAWCRPCGPEARAGSADPVQPAVEAGPGGNHDEAASRFRANQSTHWRHVALGH